MIIRKILIREANWLGDIIMSIPSLTAVHNRYPEAGMVIAAKKDFLPLFNLLPWGVETIALRGIKSWYSLREEKFDLAVIFPNSFRSALEVFLSRAKKRIGYAACGRGLFLTDKISKNKGNGHQADYYYHLLRSIGVKENRPAPGLVIKEKDKEHLRTWLKGKGVDLTRPLIAVSAAASYGEGKCWPEENFAELADRLVAHGEIVFTGTKKDAPVIERIIALTKKSSGKAKAFNLAGETSLSQLAGLFSISKTVISNDNGAMHLASVLGTNTICLFGPTDPLRTGPLGNKAVILYDKADCSPCKKRICPDKKCFSTITVDRVYGVVKNNLLYGI
jgi:heptosyltransferase-2